jgi:SAM-dependent methyltransferase
MSDAIGAHWFEELADHMGEAYLRYSFTKGTRQEVDRVIEWLGLSPGMKVLDVGCGPGRHTHELARRGIETHGVDISQAFINIASQSAPIGATFERMDARALRFESQFDAVICLCQGAFGLMTANGHDHDVLRGIRRSLKPTGRLALSAFNAYFAVKYHENAVFDAETGVSQERTTVKNAAGESLDAELWTGCYTPRELRLMLASEGFRVDNIFSVEPGAYEECPPTLESPEYMVIASNSPS